MFRIYPAPFAASIIRLIPAMRASPPPLDIPVSCRHWPMGCPKNWESFQANIPHVCLSNMWVRWPPFKDIVLGLWPIFEHQALVHPDTRPGWSWDTAATTLWQNAMEWMCGSRAGTGDRVFKAIPIPRTSRRLVAVYIIKTWLGSYRMLAVLFWKRS